MSHYLRLITTSGTNDRRSRLFTTAEDKKAMLRCRYGAVVVVHQQQQLSQHSGLYHKHGGFLLIDQPRFLAPGIAAAATAAVVRVPKRTTTIRVQVTSPLPPAIINANHYLLPVADYLRLFTFKSTYRTVAVVVVVAVNLRCGHRLKIKAIRHRQPMTVNRKNDLAR